MTHLGILQQFSLGEKTNVLKHIKSYEGNFPENNNYDKGKENDNLKKFELEQKDDINNEKNLIIKQNQKTFDITNDKVEFEINEINQEKQNKINKPEEKKNIDINNDDKNNINDDFKIFKDNKKLFFHLKNEKFQKQRENSSSDSEKIDDNNIKSNNIDLNNDKDNNINNRIDKYNYLKNENNLYNNNYDYKKENFNIKLSEKYQKENFKDNDSKKEKEENTNNIKIINQEKKNDNFICDLDIFKKLQIQMNKKSEILQKTIDKYNHKPKKFEIINDSNLNQKHFPNHPQEQNIINDNFKGNNNIKNQVNNININSKRIDINEINEKMNMNTKNLLEKINKIKNNIDNKENPIKNNNKNNIKQNKINPEKDKFFKTEIKSAQSSYEPLIFRIPSLLLDDKIEEIEIYIKLEMIYYNLKTITSKLDFISLLRQVLNNVIMLKNSSFNVFLQLFNFILSLQIYELNLSDCNPSLPCEYLKSLLDLLVNNKDLTEMIRIIIVLIKKYFPINMGIILEQKNIVTLKVLNSYLKQLNNVILTAYINIKSIFIEINDFLFFSPPSLLSDEFPLAELYMEIYEEIRNTTDNVIKSCRSKIMKNELMDAVVFIKTKIKHSSADYVKYLDYAIYKIN